MKNKKAELLTENIIFIILNIAFFSILALFIFVKANNVGSVEEAYAKKIALAIDAAKPGMNLVIDMQSAILKKSKDYNGKIVLVEGNVVTVKLRENGGYSYSFFNDAPLSKEFFYSTDGNEYSFEIMKPNKLEEIK